MRLLGKKTHREMKKKRLNMIRKKYQKKNKVQKKRKNHLKRNRLKVKLELKLKISKTEKNKLTQKLKKTNKPKRQRQNWKSLVTQARAMNGPVMLTVKEDSFGAMKVKTSSGTIRKTKNLLTGESLRYLKYSILIRLAKTIVKKIGI